MAITGIYVCDLVVWTPKGIYVQTIYSIKNFGIAHVYLNLSIFNTVSSRKNAPFENKPPPLFDPQVLAQVFEE